MYLLNLRLCCTQADLLQNIPPEFRQNVVLYDTADVRAHYPAHGISEFYSGYLPATWLMHKYQAYEFLYILESVCPHTPCRHNLAMLLLQLIFHRHLTFDMRDFTCADLTSMC